MTGLRAIRDRGMNEVGYGVGRLRRYADQLSALSPYFELLVQDTRWRSVRLGNLITLSLDRAARERPERDLVDRMAGHGDKVAYQAIGDLPGHRQLVLALELLDRGLGV